MQASIGSSIARSEPNTESEIRREITALNSSIGRLEGQLNGVVERLAAVLKPAPGLPPGQAGITGEVAMPRTTLGAEISAASDRVCALQIELAEINRRLAL